MQQVIGAFDEGYRFLDLPAPDQWVMPGVKWGRHEHPLTPAFWVSQAWLTPEVGRDGFRLGGSLAEEIAVCLLGGHGAPAEVGLAAYARVRDEMRRQNTQVLSQATLEDLLLEPLNIRGRQIRYRFARQRAKYLAGSLKGLESINEISLSDVQFRDALRLLPGIGLKTASWIVRNRRSSDEVAILDIHILRACEMMGVFPFGMDPSKHYLKLEDLFLTFCRATSTRASVLDAVMWGTMRNISPKLMHFLVDENFHRHDSQKNMTLGVDDVRQQWNA